MQFRATLPLLWAICLSFLSLNVVLAHSPHKNPFPTGCLPDPSDPLKVDLGYAGYNGVHNASSGLNQWYGIRYAQAPIGKRRWQVSKPPNTKFNGTFMDASTYGPICPQVFDHINTPPSPWSASASQSEDCLVLNVWAPENATDLPVFVWIHGGGYGAGSADTDMTWMVETSVTKFVTVAIQYRLGAFGFLASSDVQKHGTANAGLHDQFLALQWVQRYISLFGGDPDRVTIGGESAGGGSVMLQAMAYGGNLGDELFSGVFPSSPYLPQQYNYYDEVPTTFYERFAAEVGCANSATKRVFDCLVAADTKALQNASWTATAQAKYGQWAFTPVTDGEFVQQRPSVQLATGVVNGKRGLIGNNANEGVSFTPQNITTEDAFVEFVKYLIPELTDHQTQQVLSHYPLPSSLPNVRFATDGLSKDATAVFVSPFAVGQEQRAINLYSEITFVCPAYWLADAYGKKGGQSYKYQFSLINSCHGEDLPGYFGNAPPTMSQAFQDSFLSFLDSFVTHGTPSNTSSYTADVPTDTAKLLASWPSWSINNRLQMNLNQTGGISTIVTDSNDPYGTVINTYVNPGLVPDFTIVDGYAWEGERGVRCDFWKSIGAAVPEK
ncbi:carboxylesterase, putative [Talaromyces stipitatus ATCC 10500]|uniref:Carboxylic ester hydrolase n=1 Tax=Talaromyces stipitatus (strain ATCC 10500 / CBS 375.48 / QM 6759 / NRRL 1006) TaxID=441959 RepID=B8M1R2_TALSN|nr:carboxylesterase, putative [Talaromyces stipitatus ATCC 10500]EED22149.1 carboxylesterase, putative [Talaromyces stipitatus ATCC 10500]